MERPRPSASFPLLTVCQESLKPRFHQTTISLVARRETQIERLSHPEMLKSNLPNGTTYQFVLLGGQTIITRISFSEGANVYLKHEYTSTMTPSVE